MALVWRLQPDLNVLACGHRHVAHVNATPGGGAPIAGCIVTRSSPLCQLQRRSGRVASSEELIRRSGSNRSPGPPSG